MDWTSLADLGVLFAIVGQTAAIVWWASRLTANSEAVKEIVTETKHELKQHTEDDRLFQLDVTRHLSTIAPTTRRTNGEDQ